MSHHNDSEETDSNDSETPVIPINRRSVILTMAAGGLTSGSATAPVAADSGNVDVDVNDGYGGNKDGTPERLEVSPSSQFTVETPSGMSDGTIVMVTLYARPDSGSFEQLGQAAFQEAGRDKYVIEGADFSDEARNLFSHSGIEAVDWEVEKDLSRLENKANRYTEKTIEVKMTAKPRGGSVFAETDPVPFTVYYALTAGLGVNLGYNLGRKWPTDGSGDHPDFESEVGGA